MTIKQPSNVNPSAALPQDQQHQQGRLRTLNLDIFPRSDTQLEIIPMVDNFNAEMIQSWVKGRIHNLPFTRGLVSGSTNTEWRVDLSATGINSTTMIGGRLDGIAAANTTYYLIWLIMNNSNTAIVGYGLTRYPSANYTAISSGAKDADATFTLAGTTTNNAYQFTVGARVLVQSGGGTTPNFEFNYGIITSITSNTSMTIRLDNRTKDGSTTLSATATTLIRQYDRFRPWTGVTTGDIDSTNYSNNFRLIGELVTDTAGAIVWHRKATDPWRMRQFAFPAVTRAVAGTTITNYRMFRNMPLWSKEVMVQQTIARTAGVTLASAGFLVNTQLALPETMTRQVVADLPNHFETVTLHLPDDGIIGNFLTLTSGAGTLTQNMNQIGYWDGGLRE